MIKPPIRPVNVSKVHIEDHGMFAEAQLCENCKSSVSSISIVCPFCSGIDIRHAVIQLHVTETRKFWLGRPRFDWKFVRWVDES